MATPVVAGDSLASQQGLRGSGVVGASPAKVLAAVQADSRAGKYDGKPVVLSTGASNDPTDLASVEQQIREAQGGNAGRITVLGVGPAVEAKAPGTNAKLQALAKSYGADFVPLPADQMSPDGVHPTAQGYATLKAAIAPAAAAPGAPATPAPYQVASNAPTAPPASTAPAPATSGAPPAVASGQPTIPPPPEVLPNGLTREQTAEIPALRRSVQLGQKTLAEADATLLQYQTANRAAQRQYTLDVQAQQEKTQADARATEQLRLLQNADQRAADDAAQKAKAASRPVQGNDVDAQHESYLYEHANEIRDGTASEEVRRQYAGSYYALQQKGGQAVQITDPNNPGGTIAATITRRLPPSLPEPPGGALPQVFTTPGAAKAPEMTAPQSQAAGFADRMRNALPVISDTSAAAMNRWQQLLGKVPLAGNSFVSSEFQQHVQAERDFINSVLRRESGAAISESEFVNARQQYIPQPGDGQAVLAQKQRNRETVMANLIRDAGPAYRPPSGVSSTTQSSTTVPPSRVIRYDHTGKRIEE